MCTIARFQYAWSFVESTSMALSSFSAAWTYCFCAASTTPSFIRLIDSTRAREQLPPIKKTNVKTPTQSAERRFIESLLENVRGDTTGVSGIYSRPENTKGGTDGPASRASRACRRGAL